MNIDLKAERREIGKNSDLLKMRNDGFIPGIIYSVGKDSIPIKIENSVFVKKQRKAYGGLVLFNLHVADRKYRSVVKEKQIHPVTRNVLHLDFQELDENKKMTVSIPFKFIGTPIGVKNGGTFDVILRNVEISCLPKDLLEDIEIDVANLDIGDSIHMGDLDLKTVETHLSPDITIAVVHHPQSLTEAEEGTEEEEEEEAKETESDN